MVERIDCLRPSQQLTLKVVARSQVCVQHMCCIKATLVQGLLLLLAESFWIMLDHLPGAGPSCVLPLQYVTTYSHDRQACCARQHPRFCGRWRA